jgi:hypothetical protein
MLKTVSLRQLRRSVTEAAQDSECAYPRGVVRPITRADCAGGQRPCPFVSCSEFGISLQSIHRILNRRQWAHVQPEAPNGVFI